MTVHARLVVSALMVPMGFMGAVVGSAPVLGLTTILGLTLWATDR